MAFPRGAWERDQDVITTPIERYWDQELGKTPQTPGAPVDHGIPPREPQPAGNPLGSAWSGSDDAGIC